MSNGIILYNKDISVDLVGNAALPGFNDDLVPSFSNALGAEVKPVTAFGSDTYKVSKEIDSFKIKSGSSVLNPDSSNISIDRSIEEKLFDACADVKIITSQISMHLPSSLRSNIFEQLDMIHDPEEWDMADLPVNKSSFKSFIRWMLMVAPNTWPGIGLGVTGNVVAAWAHEDDRLIFEFLKNDKVKWVVIKYIDSEEEQAIGNTSIARLDEVLSPYNIDDFFIKKDY